MLNESASNRDDRVVMRSSVPPPSRADELQNQLRDKVANVMMIEREIFSGDDSETEPQGMMLESQLIGTFEGSLLTDSETAYDQLDGELLPTNHLAVFRETQPDNHEPVAASRRHTIHILTGRPHPQPRSWHLNAILFVVTIFSVLLVGAGIALHDNPNAGLGDLLLNLWRGAPYAISILLILGTHELGHYFAARHHKLAVTLPYFIPMPLLNPLGTMGAFIQLRQPMKNRKMLFDVGAAGPLAGLIFAVPILLIGLANSQPAPITTEGLPEGAVQYYEGDSLLYAGAKILTYGRFVPDGRQDICVDCNQLLWAGWTGLLVTALNLIPIGQLDGGHVLYSLIGERARRLYYPALIIMIGLVFVADVWLIWVILLLLFGRLYATPLDMITPLDNRRRYLAIFTLVVFVLIFIPAPLSQPVQPPQPLDLPRNSAMLMSGVALLLTKLRR